MKPVSKRYEPLLHEFDVLQEAGLASSCASLIYEAEARRLDAMEVHRLLPTYRDLSLVVVELTRLDASLCSLH